MDEGYKRMGNCKGQMSKSEIMTILLCYHFGSFRNFKHYYLFFIEEHLASYFLYAVSYTCFVKLMPCVFFDLCPSCAFKFLESAWALVSSTVQ